LYLLQLSHEFISKLASLLVPYFMVSEDLKIKQQQKNLLLWRSETIPESEIRLECLSGMLKHIEWGPKFNPQYHLPSKKKHIMSYEELSLITSLTRWPVQMDAS
jgi:hypothetical protein